MKTLFTVLAALALSATMALACDKHCPCPDITITCGNTTIVPGLWEVTTNKKLCGEIVLGPSWVIISGETLMLNKVKKMVLVESCD